MQRVRVLISGLVQGVNFRYWLKSKAEELGVVGWVRNVYGEDIKLGKKIRADFQGVEAVFEGTKEQIKAMIDFCWQGPMLGRVSNVEIESLKTLPSLQGFRIIHSSVEVFDWKK